MCSYYNTNNESSKASTTPDSPNTTNSPTMLDTDLSKECITQADNSPGWTTASDVSHMEVARRTLTIRPPKYQPDDKPLPVFLLEIKSSQANTQLLREALLKAPLNTRGHGIFIPPSFLIAEPKAVYNTAIRHVQYLQHLKAIPVSGLVNPRHRNSLQVLEVLDMPDCSVVHRLWFCD